MKTSEVDLGRLAARKKAVFGDHPYTEETDVLFVDLRTNKGKPTNYIVQGTDDAEVVVLGHYDDLAYMAGGDDVAIGALGSDTIFGEAGEDFLFGDTDLGITNGGSGDDDQLDGGDGADIIWGDTRFLIKGSTGGDDLITGGSGDDLIRGDAEELQNYFGGNDTIDGGEGNDTIYGDGLLFGDAMGGADVFVFGSNSGSDVIMDFRQDDGDKIDVSLLGIGSLAGLSLSSADGDTTIDLVGGNQIVLAGFGDHSMLTTDDFIFAG